MPVLPTGNPYPDQLFGGGVDLNSYYRARLAMQAEKDKEARYAEEKNLERLNVLANTALMNRGSLAHYQELNKGAAERLSQAEKFKKDEAFQVLKNRAAELHVPYTDADTPDTVAAKVKDREDALDLANANAYQRSIDADNAEIDRLSGRFDIMSPERQKETTLDVLRDPAVQLTPDQREGLQASVSDKPVIRQSGPMKGTTIQPKSLDDIRNELLKNRHLYGFGTLDPSAATALSGSIAKSVSSHSGKYDALTQLNAYRINMLKQANIDRQKHLETIRDKNPGLAEKLALPSTPATGSGALGAEDPINNFNPNRAHTSGPLELATSGGEDVSGGLTTDQGAGYPDMASLPAGRYLPTGEFQQFSARTVPSNSLSWATGLGAAGPTGGFGLTNLAPSQSAQPTNFITASGFGPANTGLVSPRQSFLQKLAAAKAHALANGVSPQQLDDLFRRANSGDRGAMSLISESTSNFDENGQPSLSDYAPLQDYPPAYKP